MPTDRELLKNALAGQIGSVGTALGSRAAAALHHQTVLTFSNIDDTATGSIAEYGYRLPFAGKVVSAYITPSSAFTADDTNYWTWTLAKRLSTDYTTAVTIGTRATNVAGGSLVAYTPTSLTITAANVIFDAGSVITIKTVDAGTTTEVFWTASVLVEWT